MAAFIRHEYDGEFMTRTFAIVFGLLAAAVLFAGLVYAVGSFAFNFDSLSLMKARISSDMPSSLIHCSL